MAEATPRRSGGIPGPRRPPVGRADEPERIRPSAAPGRGSARPSAGVPRADGPESSAPRAQAVEAEPIVETSPFAPIVQAGPAGEAVPARALQDLARAFQANAEALQGIHALQADLASALQRGDRAEMMLQSTNALNETFRNVAAVQRELLRRLEAPPPGPGRMLPLMVIGLLVVFVGGIAAVIHVVDRMREERTDPLLLAAEMESARRRGQEEAAAHAEKESLQSARALEEAEARLRALQAKDDENREALDQVRAEQRAREAEHALLAEEAVRLRGEGAARRAVEEEMRANSTRLAVLEPRLKELEADLARERAEKQRLQARIAEHRMGIAPEAPEEAAAPAASEPPRHTTPVSRDARQLEAIRGRINQLLEAAGRGKSEYWQLTKAEGVSTDRLHEVVAARYDGRGRLLDSVEAEELAVWVDKARHTVEFEFRRGNVVFDRQKTPFRGDTQTRIVGEGDNLMRLWLGSGILLLRTR
jgi:hypothetical protein